jgi:hypothetical protein
MLRRFWISCCLLHLPTLGRWPNFPERQLSHFLFRVLRRCRLSDDVVRGPFNLQLQLLSFYSLAPSKLELLSYYDRYWVSLCFRDSSSSALPTWSALHTAGTVIVITSTLAGPSIVSFRDSVACTPRISATSRSLYPSDTL